MGKPPKNIGKRDEQARREEEKQEEKEDKEKPEGEEKQESEELALIDAKRKRALFDASTLPVGIRDVKDARLVVNELHAGERKLLFDALRKIMADQYLEHKRLGSASIHHEDLIMLWHVYFIPSFLFGFLDSAFLIITSKGIDMKFAEVYGMSLLTSAALANVVSNIVLQRSHDQTIRALRRFGIQQPVFSAEQMNNKDRIDVMRWARMVGMLIGSLLGLFPLFFFDDCFDMRNPNAPHWLEKLEKPFGRDLGSTECGEQFEKKPSREGHEPLEVLSHSSCPSLDE